MRRFSQRNSLVTLNEINITPLLDLAFVLLLIFIITRPMLEGHLQMKLPDGSTSQTSTLSRSDIRVVEISRDGQYSLAGRRLNMRQLETELVTEFRQNPKIVVRIRADGAAPYRYVFAVTDACTKNHINQVSFSFVPEGSR
jgi:biopolymer transport protein ExbD